jgi:hypothetical protein
VERRRGGEPNAACHAPEINRRAGIGQRVQQSAAPTNLSAGALRGTNPGNPADRHNALMVEAERILDDAARPSPPKRAKARDSAGAMGAD